MGERVKDSTSDGKQPVGKYKIRKPNTKLSQVMRNWREGRGWACALNLVLVLEGDPPTDPKEREEYNALMEKFLGDAVVLAPRRLAAAVGRITTENARKS